MTCESKVVRLIRPLYKRVLPNWIEYTGRELAGCNSVLDIGCGYDSVLNRYGIPFTVGLDIFLPYLEESRRRGLHSDHILADMTRVEFKPNSFDAVVAIEVLDHLVKRDAISLIARIESWARRIVIIKVTNGYVWQDALDGNPGQEHRSFWAADELRHLGYRVYGMGGLKCLRGYRGIPKCRPHIFWDRVCDMTQRLVHHNPDGAFQLFAVKQIQEFE